PYTTRFRSLLLHQQEEVQRDQRDQDQRDEEDVEDVEPGQDLRARELPTKYRRRRPRADHRDREHDRRGDPQAGAGEGVVGERVAGEALEEAEPEQQQADDPVELTRLAERTGEEDPEH